MKNYLFPKFFQNATAVELAQYCRSIGIDGPTLLIRDGYPVTQDNMKQALPIFVKEVRDNGADVVYADTPYHMHELGSLGEELSMLSANGIRYFRTNYISRAGRDVRELHDTLCRGMEIAEREARRHGIKAVVQIHGGMYPHNATAAYFACRQFDPQYLGIKLDPGNNIQQEGYEAYEYQVDLLDQYVAALGQKDAILTQDPTTKGWRRTFAPADVGVNDYNRVFACLKKHELDVPGIFMPFYHDNDLPALKEAFAREVEYILRCQKNNGL